MSFASEHLEKNVHWRDLISFIERGTVPNAIGIQIRLPWQEETLHALASHILCEKGTACGTCRSCRAWVDGEHPDLLIAGAPDTPSPVEECRAKAGELSIIPVVAPVRLLAFYAPEKMSPGAVNSLLKITEEPPSRGRILYMMNKAEILPTLRSRLWMLSFSLEEEVEPLQPPTSQNEWLSWLQRNEKNDSLQWYNLAHGYASWLFQNGDLLRASSLRQLAETAMTTHLSSSMWADLLFLLLREEYPFGNVFDDLRQTALPGAYRSRR